MPRQTTWIPTVELLASAISSATDGAARDYLVLAAAADLRVNETTMRNAFVELRNHASDPDACDLCYRATRDLNAFYRTRYPLRHLGEAADIAFRAVQERGWWESNPPTLLTCAQAEAEALSAFVVSTLKQISDAHLNNPYSLLTKWLHFCFPDSFVIYDAQVAASIQTWSYFTYPLYTHDTDKFLAAKTWVTDGSGYTGVIDFYRTCWQYSTEFVRDGLHSCAADLSNLIEAPVSVLDVIDKLIWLANGDPRKMGLL